MPDPRFRHEVAWNLASFAILGASGILINVLIGLYYDSAALGVFNQVYAVYIFFSQLAVGGVHLSVQRHISQLPGPAQRESATIATASLGLTLFFATVAAAVFFLAAPLTAQLLKSPGVEQGMRLAAPGLFFFAFNKVWLGILNGHRRMVAYANFQSTRSLLMIGGIALAAFSQWPAERLAFVFTFAEGLLFLALAGFSLTHLRQVDWSNVRDWARTHLSFGARGFLSGVLSELNTRIDVLMLGFFLDDSTVGAYSMAAMLAEGVFQLPVVIRANYNPLLSERLARSDREDLQTLIRKGVRLSYLAMGGVCLAGLLLYPVVLPLITNKADLASTWSVFAILIAGVLIASGYSPFYNLFVQAGFPGLYTIKILLLVLINVVLNIAFIPWLGADGAALATAISWGASVPILKFLARRRLQLRI